MTTTIPYVTLNNGLQMPQLGLGVWKAQDGPEVEQAVKTALECGYRMIDTAAAYDNEQGVGSAIQESGVSREEIFVTTKLWNAEQGYDSTFRAFDQSLDRLGMDYVDLYLIHWPMPDRNKFKETWKAMEQLYEEGRTRAIGVSNFKPAHLEDLLASAKVIPAINQIELHPLLTQKETRDYCKQHRIQIESWSPIMRGGESLENPVIRQIADVHGRTPAQIVLRWHIQSGFVVIPKSVTPDRIRENSAIFDFELDDDEMQKLDSLNTDQRFGPDPDSFNG